MSRRVKALVGIGPQPVLDPAANESAEPSREWHFTLPWPPSVNHCYRAARRPARGGGQYIAYVITQAAKNYQFKAIEAAGKQRLRKLRLATPLGLAIVAHPPNQQLHDLDNLLKPTLDALKLIGLIADDRWIDDLHIRRGPVVEDGRLEIALRRLPADP